MLRVTIKRSVFDPRSLAHSYTAWQQNDPATKQARLACIPGFGFHGDAIIIATLGSPNPVTLQP